MTTSTKTLPLPCSPLAPWNIHCISSPLVIVLCSLPALRGFFALTVPDWDGQHRPRMEPSLTPRNYA
ncbi:hypothetical protein M407DRAFT_242240 [Tulasnella calospora MUT 4182]|uniref:Uncharacterized protein n=1 Tax=Tulasnella calospora MUT 4182 TaxID=1051891 RepID=A0A0C3QFU6_9AGAM|nr:hypothetical protein M407DRAFT_242240 [Tulasnella calospora MUT 4182]